jgi:hypothetical protein
MSISGIQTFKELFNIEIPKGILLYSQCGKDTYEPISLFIDSIKSFHFTDVNKIEMPLLQCMTRKKEEVGKKTKLIRGDDLITGFIPTEVVCDVIEERRKYKFYNVVQDFNKYFNVDVGEFIIKDNLKKQIWMLNESNALEVVTHSMNTISALLKFEEIAVYYHRCRNKGGRGIKREKLSADILNIVLDRLLPGGIILSDSDGLIDKRLQFIGKIEILEKYLNVWRSNK